MNSALPTPLAILLVFYFPLNGFPILMERVIRVLTHAAPQPYYVFAKFSLCHTINLKLITDNLQQSTMDVKCSLFLREPLAGFEPATYSFTDTSPSDYTGGLDCIFPPGADPCQSFARLIFCVAKFWRDGLIRR